MTNIDLINGLKECVRLHIKPYNLGDMGKTAELINEVCKRLESSTEKPNVSGELAKELLNGIIAADPNVINDYESGDFVIRSLYNQCQKLIKSLNSNDR